MKIAQVAPLYESVPPHGYGGTERVVSYLTEELVRLGEEVTLFASGDSKTAAHLIPISPRSLRLGKAVDTLAHHIVLLEEVFQRLDQFDIVHFHIDYLHFPLSRRASFAHVTTLHGRLDLPDLPVIMREFSMMPLASLTLICSFMTSPHSGAPTRPVPTPGVSLVKDPTLRGLL